MLKEVINNFIDNNLNVKDFIKIINNLNKTDIEYIYNITDDLYQDQMMNAIIIIWLLKYNMINLNSDLSNPYLNYLNELSDDFNIQEVKFLKITNYTITAKIITNNHPLYIIINHSNDDCTINVPLEIIGQKLFCRNCNHDMILSETIELPEYSFYAFEKC